MGPWGMIRRWRCCLPNIAVCTIISGRNFSQVTNPPIDPLRERQVMSLATRLGNLGNILEEDESQMSILQLDSPVLLNSDFQEGLCLYR